jgi:protein TonB|tara:strand:- start:208 stop:987 length:780 start_codon:yes stop_codon:yes gene_type:complete
MDTSKKPLVNQNNSSNEHTKPKKKDANLKYNPTVYFLIGLAITLFSTYSLFEMNFKVKNQTSFTTPPPLTEDPFIYKDVSYVVEKEKVIVKKQHTSVAKDPIISEDPIITEIPEFIIEPIDSGDTSVPVSSIVVQDPDEDLEVILTIVEHVPEYPGCEKGSNTEKRKCMSKKIAKFVQRKFNTDLASDLGLTGKQKINVVFKIDKNGTIIGVRSRAPHPRLEQEAARVINLLPKMKPGRQRGKAVVVPYSLPIVFQVQN